jgi:IS5 family transposase
VARQRGEAATERLKTTYQALLEVTATVVTQARQVQEVVTTQSTAVAQRVAGTLARLLPRVEQVITQTTRRVLYGEQVPASEKSVSLFEPETAIIRKGKPGKPTEFGRVLWRDEVEGGIISRYAVLDGNPDEKAQVPRSLAHHRRQFGHPPTLLPGDRGL